MAVVTSALDTVTETGAITTIWVQLVTTKHPQSNAIANDIAHKCTIEVGYTIYWKNASPTLGTYNFNRPF